MSLALGAFKNLSKQILRSPLGLAEPREAVFLLKPCGGGEDSQGPCLRRGHRERHTGVPQESSSPEFQQPAAGWPGPLGSPLRSAW